MFKNFRKDWEEDKVGTLLNTVMFVLLGVEVVCCLTFIGLMVYALINHIPVTTQFPPIFLYL